MILHLVRFALRVHAVLKSPRVVSVAAFRDRVMPMSLWSVGLRRTTTPQDRKWSATAS